MPTDESYIAPLFNPDAPKAMAKGIGEIVSEFHNVEAAANAMAKSMTTNFEGTGAALKKVIDNLDYLKSSSGAVASSVAAASAPASTPTLTSTPAATPTATPAASPTDSPVATAIGTMTATLENLANRFVAAITNVFGGGANAAGPTTGGEAMLPGGGAGPAGAPSAGGGSNVGDTLAAAGLYAAGQAGGAAVGAIAATATPGAQWATSAQQLAPTLGLAYNASPTAISGAMVKDSGGANYAGSIPQLTQAESVLAYTSGYAPGSSQFQGAMNQASALGLVTGLGIGAGASGDAALATAQGRNFLVRFGIPLGTPQSQSVLGVAEQLATRLNGGTFPSTERMQGMLGAGQPLNVNLGNLMQAVNMPASAATGIISLLLAESKTEKDGQYLSLGSDITAPEAQADEKTLGVSDTQTAQMQAAQTETTSAKFSRSTAAGVEKGAIEQQQAKGKAANDLGWAAGLGKDAGQITAFLGLGSGAGSGAVSTLLKVGPDVLEALGAGGLAKAGWSKIFGKAAPEADAVPEAAAADTTAGLSPEAASILAGSAPLDAGTLGAAATAGATTAVAAIGVGDVLSTMNLNTKLRKLGLTKSEAATVDAVASILPGESIGVDAAATVASKAKGAWDDIFGGGGKASATAKMTAAESARVSKLGLVGKTADRDGYTLHFNKGSIVIHLENGGNTVDATKMAEELVAEIGKAAAAKKMVKS